MSAESCPSCGKPWTAHPGIAAICVRLKAAEAENKRIRARVYELELKKARDKRGELVG